MKLRPLSPSRYARLERDEAALRAAAERPKDKEVKQLYGGLGGGALGGKAFLPLTRSRYARQLRALLRVFPREQLHVISSDELFRDPLAVAHALAERVGLPRAALTQEHVDAAFTRAAPCDATVKMSEVDQARLRAFLRERGDTDLAPLGIDLSWGR